MCCSFKILLYVSLLHVIVSVSTQNNSTTNSPPVNVKTNCARLKRCMDRIANKPNCTCPLGGQGNVDWFNGCLLSNGFIDRCPMERAYYVCFDYEVEYCLHKQESCYERFHEAPNAADNKAIDACNKLIPS